MSESIIPAGTEVTLPILPLRNSVLFPASVVPVNVGRPRSVRLIEEAFGADRPTIGVVAQRKPETEDPRFDEVYGIGTLARVLKVIRLSSGNYSVVLQGVGRMRVLGETERHPCLRALAPTGNSGLDPTLIDATLNLRRSVDARRRSADRRRATTASRNPMTIPTGEARFVQFIHPGGEHQPAGAGRDWNAGKKHQRIFVRSPGIYIDAEGTEQYGPMFFWAEWEAEADLVCSYQVVADAMPRYLFDPSTDRGKASSACRTPIRSSLASSSTTPAASNTALGARTNCSGSRAAP